MRLAAVLLILCVPIARAAPTEEAHKPAHHATTHKPISHRPVGHPARPQATHGKPTHAAPPPAKPQPAAPPVAKPAPPPGPPVGRETHLPIPRFASLKSGEVNFRRGPGDQSPIDWLYQRRGLPVEIEREFGNYRLVRDPQGTRGWVHEATLSGRRTAVIVGGEQTLRQGASAGSAAAAKLKPGVIVRLRSCGAGSEWCEVQVGDYRGFLRRDEIWGLLPGEVIP